MAQKNAIVIADKDLQAHLFEPYRSRRYSVDAGVLTVTTDVDEGRKVAHFAPGTWRFVQYELEDENL